MNKAKHNKSKKAAVIKASVLVAVGAAMLFLTPLVFRILSDALALNYPSGTACGSCEFGYGLRTGAGAAGASGVWVLAAFILLVANIINLGRLKR